MRNNILEYTGPQCGECGSGFSHHKEGMSTLVAYISPPGHNHDDNCQSRIYVCENGHKTNIHGINRCPAEDCGWITERANCGCSGPKAEWPETV